MQRSTTIVGVAAMLLCGRPVTGQDTPTPDGGVLRSGVPASFSLGPVSSPPKLFGNWSINVPAGTTQFKVQLDVATSNVTPSLYISYAQPVILRDLGGGFSEVTTRFGTSSRGTSSITVTPSSSPPLQVGTYYVAVILFAKDVTANVTVTATVTATSPAPQITAGGVVGAGLSNPAVKSASPNGIISIFGQNFTQPGSFKLVGAGDLVDGKLPTNIAGLCVQVGSERARFFHVFEKQLNVQMPAISDRGPLVVRVIQNCGQPGEVGSNPETVTVLDVSPEFFFFKQTADGKNPIAAVDAVSGAFIGSSGLLTGATFTPAKPDEILALFSTGLGATSPAFQAGELPDKSASTTQTVTVTVGGISAQVLYAGVAPGLAGLYQINIRVPANAPDGDLPVSATIAGASTPPGAFITVKK